jgi:hypothetical protein
MRKFVKTTLLVVGIALVGIQFIPIQRNTSAEVPPSDFMVTEKPPDEIKSLITGSCYNCHSNDTDYPWYSNFQPFRWMIQNHIANGKAELNLSEWGNYSGRMKRLKRESMISQIEDGEMPLWSYTLIHREAALTDSEKKALLEYLSTL